MSRAAAEAAARAAIGVAGARLVTLDGPFVAFPRPTERKVWYTVLLSYRDQTRYALVDAVGGTVDRTGDARMRSPVRIVHPVSPLSFPPDDDGARWTPAAMRDYADPDNPAYCTGLPSAYVYGSSMARTTTGMDGVFDDSGLGSSATVAFAGPRFLEYGFDDGIGSLFPQFARRIALPSGAQVILHVGGLRSGPVGTAVRDALAGSLFTHGNYVLDAFGRAGADVSSDTILSTYFFVEWAPRGSRNIDCRSASCVEPWPSAAFRRLRQRQGLLRKGDRSLHPRLHGRRRPVGRRRQRHVLSG